MKKLTLLDTLPQSSAATIIAKAYRYCDYIVQVVRISEDGLGSWLENFDEGEPDALLVIHRQQRAPATIVTGPVVALGKDRIYKPIACMPVVSERQVKLFCKNLRARHAQQTSGLQVALLGQWHSRFLKLSSRMHDILSAGKSGHFRWTSDLVFREDMMKGLGSGMPLAIYVGHGKPQGWSGYRGVQIKDIMEHMRGSAGSIIQLCCETASRRSCALSFAENLVVNGKAMCCLAAVRKTLHTDNTRWAVNLCNNLRESENLQTVSELIVASLPQSTKAATAYRLIGDPFASLHGTVRSFIKAGKIKTYA